MRATRQNPFWPEHQKDPDNWLLIPDFGVLPQDVQFSGFAYPIFGPTDESYEWRGQLSVAVHLIRGEARKRFASLPELRRANRRFLEYDVWDKQDDGSVVIEAPYPWTDLEVFAYRYNCFFYSITAAISATRLKPRKAFAHLATALVDAVGLVKGAALDIDGIKAARKQIAHAGSVARHAPMNVARERARAEWAAHKGEYSSKADFARIFAARLPNEFEGVNGKPLHVTVKTITEAWLKNTPSAGKPAG